MTTIRFAELAAPAFRQAQAELNPGLWVILVYRDDAAEQFTRTIAGVDTPRKGRISIDGHSPRKHAATRSRLISVLPEEHLDFGRSVRNAVAFLATIRGIEQSPENILRRLSLEAWASRTVGALSPRELRQVALALAMAQPHVSAAILHEPLLALNDTQLSAFRQWLAESAADACVVCVTSSLNDARELGGPHARLLAHGWEPSIGSVTPSSLECVHLEGKDLRELTSVVALKWTVGQLELQPSPRGDMLHVTGLTRDVTTAKIAQSARELGVSVRRLWSESLAGVSLEGESATVPSAVDAPGSSDSESTITKHSTFVAAMQVVRIALRGATRPMSLAVLLLEPGVALAYASLLRSRSISWANYDTLVLVGTVLVPIGSLWLCRDMWDSHTRNELVDVIGRYGVNRRTLAITRALAMSMIGALIGAASALLAVLCASSGRGNPPVGELYQCAWIVGLTGLVYGAIAVSFSNFKRPWVWRWAFILLDIALGGAASSLSFPFPRAHVHNLLGSPTSVDFSQPGSCIYLGVLFLLAIGLTSVTTEP